MSTWKKIIDTLFLHYKVRRFRRLVNFVHILLGIVLVDGWKLDVAILPETISIFFILGVLIYGALHALNNIADRKEGLKIRRKAHRIVANGQLSLTWLYMDVTASILIALVLLWYYYPKFLGFAFAFIILNI